MIQNIVIHFSKEFLFIFMYLKEKGTEDGDRSPVRWFTPKMAKTAQSEPNPNQEPMAPPGSPCACSPPAPPSAASWNASGKSWVGSRDVGILMWDEGFPSMQ